jgi:spermidine synthase
MERPRGQRDPTRVLRVLFFFSGFPALIYQLVWQRALFGILGVNVESVTIVVTAFMLGLGLGSLAGGWLSRRRRLALLPLLAAIEGLTAAFGLVSLRVFDAVGERVLGAPLPAVAAVTLSLVAIPTLLMGATLPVLVAHLVRRTASVGGAVGTLYHVNTLGAGVACLVAAVVLFPFLGIRGSLHTAVAMNAAVALGALAAYRRGSAAEPSGGAPGAPGPGAPALRFGAVVALSGLGGLVALSYEIFFFRVVSYATGSSASAFAATLFAYLTGLASGARRAGRSCAASRPAALRAAVRALAAGNALGWAFLPLVAGVAALGWVSLAVALALVYLAARELGVLLPTLAHLGVRADGDAGMRTAHVYLANILGSAAGSVVTGFVLMDRVSLTGIAAALAAGGAGSAALLLAAAPVPRRRKLAGAGAALALGAAAVLLVRPLSAGALHRLMWKADARARPPFARVVENRSGIIAVDAAGAVFGHGMYDGRFNTDLVHDTNGIVRAYALGLFHPAPRDVLVIGLSSGSWAQVIATHPGVESVTIVEINPGYLGLVARTPSVASLLSNPKVRIAVDDGRRWLRTQPDRRFDAIVSNTTYHFRANASALLSTEFLALARDHLKPGGVLVYNTTGSARVQRTGCLSFAHGLRFSNQLVVSTSPLDVDAARWRRDLEHHRIDGRPVLDAARPEDRRALLALEALAAEAESPRPGPAPDAPFEACPDILARTAGLRPVTDDNMGSEWRFIYGLE